MTLCRRLEPVPGAIRTLFYHLLTNRSSSAPRPRYQTVNSVALGTAPLVAPARLLFSTTWVSDIHGVCAIGIHVDELASRSGPPQRWSEPSIPCVEGWLVGHARIERHESHGASADLRASRFLMSLFAWQLSLCYPGGRPGYHSLIAEGIFDASP
jgi:hypothetical protein